MTTFERGLRFYIKGESDEAGNVKQIGFGAIKFSWKLF